MQWGVIGPFKEGVKELASRWTLLGVDGQHGYAARCVLVEKALEFLVPLLPVPHCPLPFFVREFYQTFQDGHPE